MFDRTLFSPLLDFFLRRWICEAVFFPLHWYQVYEPESDSDSIPQKSNLDISAISQMWDYKGTKSEDWDYLSQVSS